MDAMDEPINRRCPHYQLYAQPLNIENGPDLLAVRRCMLAERLIGLLEKTPNGRMLTQRLTVRIHTQMDVAIVGPDLEAVTQTACSVSRCEERCTPGYVAHLNHFNGVDPCLDEVTCQEESNPCKPIAAVIIRPR
jgi:hypothetical protein